MNFNLLSARSSDVEDRYFVRREREFCYFEKGNMDDPGMSLSAIPVGRAEWVGRSSVRTLLAL